MFFYCNVTGLSSPTLPGGPGLGVRQTPAPFRHIPAYKRLLDKDLDREVAKLEKFKSLLEAPSVNLGEV